jgi:hypothetical protein
MRTIIETFDMSAIVTPAQQPDRAAIDALQFNINLTVLAGDMIAIRTDNNLADRYAVGGANGTGVASYISKYSFKTDANGQVYFGDTNTPSLRQGPFSTAPCWKSGVFEPADVKIAGVAATAAQIDTAFGTKTRKLANGFVDIMGH